ncbi:major capsid protein [Bifidobacterium choerinum]|uniref:major capsid protein n=1 Tax=Bifidobacterium choerinum TaxID=35760 RepID=UPI003F9031CF
MAITLTEAAKLSTTDLQKGVLETFVQTSPVSDRLPMLEIEGNAYAYNSEATLPGVEFRAVNGSYSESTGTVNQKSETLAILGGDADVDRFIQQTRSNLNDQRATQTAMKVKAISYKFQDTFINGDSDTDANSFDGLKKRLTGNQVIDAASNGLNVVGSSNADIHTFLDKLDELLAAVPGINGTNGAIYANAKIIRKIASALRHVSLDTVLMEDIAGKRTIQWNGIPILDLGATAAAAPVDILPLTETQGTANNASSIYAVKFGADEGDQAVTGLTNGGVQVEDLGQLQSKPAYRTRIEFYCGLAVFGGKAAARLKGVLNG